MAKWTEEELQILTENFRTMRGCVSELIPAHSSSACIQKATQLGLKNWKLNKRWSDKEVAIIREFYGTEGPDVYKRLKGRTRVACRRFAQSTGLYYNDQHLPWEKSEIKFLIENFPRLGKDICKCPEIHNRTPDACLKIAREWGVVYTGGKRNKERYCKDWTPEEVRIFKEHFLREQQNIIHFLPNRSWKACRYKAEELGLTIETKEIN